MSMGTFTVFDTATLWEADGTGLLVASNTFKMILDQSSDALNSSSVQLYSGINFEVPNGNGYTTGGVTLTGVTLTRSGGTTTFNWTGPSPAWTSSGAGIPAWRWIVVYASGTLNGHVNPLVGFCLGNVLNVDVPATASGATIAIVPSTGVIQITHSP